MRVLMVCLGNICRSPTAEGVFRARLQESGMIDVVVDSAGTAGYHVGDAPDPRTVRAARSRGIDLSALRARQLRREDAEAFDLVVAMDRSNLRNIERCFAGVARASPTALFLSFAESSSTDEVPDPYSGGPADFERVLDLCERASDGLIAAIREGRVRRRTVPSSL